MKSKLLSNVLAGALALGMVAGVAVPAGAGPAGYVGAPAAAPSSDVIRVGQWESGNFREGGVYRGNDYKRQKYLWKYGNQRRVRNHDNWDNDYKYRRHHRRHWNDDYWGVAPGFYLGLGVPSYRYYNEPHRVYRRTSSAHVDWCERRWKSYHAWDNTYQPKHGKRRQCISPFS